MRLNGPGVYMEIDGQGGTYGTDKFVVGTFDCCNKALT
jgi:hypothetical protein